MGRKLIKGLMVLVIIASLGIMLYPAFSDWWNARRQSELLSDYESRVQAMQKEDFSAEWAKARAYNDRITVNNIYGDVFSSDRTGSMEQSYRDVLNVAGNGVMGYIEIPKIDIKIPIYHGVGDDVLQDGAGHMPGVKLPIGGSSSNSVLCAHRGLPSARLFTDIDQLGAGDVFYIHVLDETLCYRVEKIWAMVGKNDIDTMTSALSIEEGRDLVSLFTCTPYGVNSHRLIVRGERYFPGAGDDILDNMSSDSMLRIVMNGNAVMVAAGIAGVLSLIALWNLQGYVIRYRRIRRDMRGNNKIK